MPNIPPPLARRLTPAQASSIARRARKLLRRGAITHRQLALLDCLLWSCRSPATGAIVVSYTALQRLAHMARETVAAGLRRLEAVGLLSRIKRRVRLAWHQGGQASRQATSAYVIHPPSDTEFAPATVNQGIEVTYVRQLESCDVREATEALKGVLARRMGAIFGPSARKRGRLPLPEKAGLLPALASKVVRDTDAQPRIG